MQFRYPLIPLLLLTIPVSLVFAAGDGPRVERGAREQIKVFLGGMETAVHHFGPALDKPYFHPLWTPDRRIVTYDAPADHVHHRGLCVGWADISNTDFWAEIWSPGGRRGRIDTQSVITEPTDDGGLAITEHNVWLREDGTELLGGEMIWTFHPPRGNLQLLDLDMRLTATADEAVFGSDPGQPRPYHGLCLRVGPFEDVRYFNSEGIEGGQNCKGVKAKWCAVGGLQNGKPALAAILDSPLNAETPARYYIQDRGMQFVSSSPNYDQPKILKKGETWRLRYRTVAAGEPDGPEGWDLDALWNQYAQSQR